MLRKQINPLEKLEVLKSKMPDTMFQTLCRGINLFGYRPYPDNVIRLTVQRFADVSMCGGSSTSSTTFRTWSLSSRR